jgi:RNA polymerase sigma-70 factor (ECF subfamily)
MLGRPRMTSARDRPVLFAVPGSPRAPEPTDAELVLRARAGDRGAEEAIYRRHAGYVASLCLRMLRDREELADLVQDTFVDVLTQLPQLREPELLRRWIAGVAIHKVHRRFRRRRLRQLLGLYDSSHDELVTLKARADSSPELRAELALLDRQLAQLPDAERAAWILRNVDGYQLEEVAAFCNCSLATAKRRIAAADARVRTKVELQQVEHD